MNGLENRNLRHRYIILGAFLLSFVIVFTVVLFNLQIVNGENYRENIINQTERAYPIKASRGEILDAYGRPMVTNRMGYYIRIQDVSASDNKINETIAVLLGIMNENGEEFLDEFPIKGEPLDFVFENSEDKAKKVKEWKKENDFKNSDSINKIMDSLAEKYGVDESYTGETRRNIIAIRYSMEQKYFGVTPILLHRMCLIRLLLRFQKVAF